MFRQGLRQRWAGWWLMAWMAVAFSAVLQAADAEKETGKQAGVQYTECKKPRPEICYEVFRPVCATRDTGVRCVTTPCPSTETMTYSNDCKACADQRVARFQPGSCEDLAIELLIPKPTDKSDAP